jgi:diguanylate cyclase (GGDEF)-like protein/PAS domain S-box-containing protein
MTPQALQLPTRFPLRQALLNMLLVAVLYVLLAKAALAHFALVDSNVSLVWPSSGLALAALLIGGRQYAWPVLAGAFTTNALLGSPIHIALMIGMGATLSALTTHQLLAMNKRFNSALEHPGDYFSLMAAAALGTLVSASVGVTALWSADIIPAAVFRATLLNWWQGDTLGMLLLTPFILVWRRRPKSWFKSIPRAFETLACFGLLLLTGQVEFMNLFSPFIGTVTHLHPAFLFAAWAAVRFGRRGVTLVVILTAIQALVGAARGTGVFAHDFEQTHMLNFWLYAITLSTVGISIALSIAHRKQIQAQLSQSEAFKDVILNSVAAQIAVIDRQGVIQVVNERWQQAALVNSPAPGKPAPNTGVGSNYLLVCHGGTTADANALDAYAGIQAVLQGRLPSFSLEYPCHTPQQQRWFNMIVMPLRKDAQDGATITHTDITQVKQVQEDLRQSYAAIQSIQKTTPDGYCRTDFQGRLLEVNASYCQTSGYTQDELLRMCISDLEAIESPGETAARMTRLIAQGHDQFETQHRRKDGSLWQVEVSATVNDKLSTPSIFAFSRDITLRKKLLAQLTQSESHMRAVFDAALDAVVSMDSDGRIIDWNNQAHIIFDWRKEEVMGKMLHDIIAPPQYREAYQQGMAHFLATGQTEVLNRRIEITALRRSGEQFPVELSILPFKTDDGYQFTGFIADISERKRMEEEVRRLAYFDPLTQLPNRRMLHDRLNQSMAASKRSGRYGAMMILDLDNFKPLNDLHGHLVGDLLLVEVARRLMTCVREVDTVARFGGDEFVVMICELDEDKAQSLRQAQVVAEKIRLALAEPYVLSFNKENQIPTRVEHHCTASIGVVLFINHETTPENIMKWADAAMYQAKDAGRNVIRFYTVSDESSGCDNPPHVDRQGA